MFVSGLFSEFRKRVEEGSIWSRHSEEMSRLAERQRVYWTPPDVLAICCPLWIEYGLHSKSRTAATSLECRLHVSSRTSTASTLSSLGCHGGCHKSHPTIILFYDTKKATTVAVVSHRLDPFTAYLEERVQECSATFVSPLYYELKGFVRENVHRMKQQNYFGSHMVQVAIGALQESDDAQRQSLLEQKTGSTCGNERKVQPSFLDLEQILEICRLHRLGDDLDVLSIYCMARTSRTMRRIAQRMVTRRLNETRIRVIPLVDGFFLTGNSTFWRSTPITILGTGSVGSLSPEANMTTEREQGKLVEYVKQEGVDLEALLVENSEAGTRRKFLPMEGSYEFSWNCYEMSFAYLEREWGDIGFQEYVGQKLVIEWEMGEADKVGNLTEMTLGKIPISATTKILEGRKEVSKPFFSIQVDLHENMSQLVGGATTRFHGRAEVVVLQMHFLCLVRAYALKLETQLQHEYAELEEFRPILDYEERFLQEVHNAAWLHVS